MRRTLRRLLAASLLLALLAAACGDGAGDEDGAGPGPGGPTPLTVRLGFTWAAAQYYAVYLLGVERGYFRDEGLEVEFVEGSGSATTVQLVGSGDADIGAAVASGALIRGRTVGAPAVMVAATTPVNPLAVISREADPVRAPADLVGRRLAVPTGAEPEQMLPAFLELNDLDEEQVEVVPIAADQLRQALVTGQVDAYAAYLSGMPFLEISLGVPAVGILWADHGVVYAPGEGVIVNEEFLAEHPDVVRRFLRALDRTFTAALEQPRDAAAAGARLREEIDEEVAHAELADVVLPLVRRHLDEGNRLFEMSEDDWEGAIDLLATYAGLEDPLPAGEYFTNDYLPDR